MRTEITSRPAGVAWSGDPDARRAGLLAAAEAASLCGRDAIRSVLVFASGAHAAATGAVARGAAEHLDAATVIAIGGVGIVTPDGESQGATAVTALALRAPIHAAVATASDDPAAIGRTLGDRIACDRPRPVLFFCHPSSLGPATLAELEAHARAQVIIGGGLAPEGGLSVVSAGGEVETGVALAVRIDGGLRLSVGVSPGVRMLSTFLPIEKVEDGFVTELGGRRPLDVLAESVAPRKDRPLVLAALTHAADPEPRAPLVRAITGVNPTRGAVHIGVDARPGDLMAFAALDAAAAREHLVATLREVELGTAGGVPLAGIYIDCAGRGVRLHGRAGVDVKAIRDRFPDLPFAGMTSTFEIAPTPDHPRLHTFTGVAAILYAPS